VSRPADRAGHGRGVRSRRAVGGRQRAHGRSPRVGRPGAPSAYSAERVRRPSLRRKLPAAEQAPSRGSLRRRGVSATSCGQHPSTGAWSRRIGEVRTGPTRDLKGSVRHPGRRPSSPREAGARGVADEMPVRNEGRSVSAVASRPAAWLLHAYAGHAVVAHDYGDGAKRGCRSQLARRRGGAGGARGPVASGHRFGT
jgi:hypothetical protein